jgi:hypothetical protein
MLYLRMLAGHVSSTVPRALLVTVGRLAVVLVTATAGCTSSSGLCGDGAIVPLTPVRRVQAVDPSGRALETMVSRILGDRTRTDTVAEWNLARISPGGNSLRAMTLAVLADGYQEAVVEIDDICYPSVDRPLIVPLRPR